MKELLLLLCRYPFNESDREALSELLGKVRNWPDMVRLINDHGIIALAAYNIKEAKLEKKVPLEILAVLESGYRKNFIRNIWLEERWKEVNSILSNAGIKHILLKGMALEHTLYGSRGLRQMSDNDIYVNPSDSARAWQLLQKEGFTPEPLKSPLLSKIMFEFGRHLPALYKEGYVIEIHNKLFEGEITKSGSSDNYFSDAVEININNTQALILSYNLQQRYLIEHFEHHRRTGECQLRLYADIVLSDSLNSVNFPDNFLPEPIQIFKTAYRKALYQKNLSTVPGKYLLRYILGDTFPSLTWMKERYKCNNAGAILRYPLRIAKLRWLVIKI